MHGAPRTMQSKLKIKLKRGYSVEVKQDIEISKSNEIIILGNYSKSSYQGTVIVSKYGITPTVRENHGQVTAVLIDVVVEERGKNVSR